MQAGRVLVDGVAAKQPGVKIDPETNRIQFDGRLITPVRHHYIAVNKPPGCVCTSHDPQGRPRVIDLVPKSYGRLYTIGRLDVDSEGLILLTNDGAFAHRLAHPRHHVHKMYEIWINQALTQEEQATWITGIKDRDETLSVLEISELPKLKSGVGYRVVLGEGKNRHLRRMAERSGKIVLRLQRIAVGKLKLGGLKRSAWRELTEKERAILTSATTTGSR